MQYYGCPDDRFGWESFGDQPDYLIFQALEFYRRQKHAEANQQTMVHAVGWSGLFNGLGSGGNKIEPWQLLPYPDEARQVQQRLSPKTAEILAELVKQKKLPYRIVAIASQFEEVAELMGEE